MRRRWKLVRSFLEDPFRLFTPISVFGGLAPGRQGNRRVSSLKKIFHVRLLGPRYLFPETIVVHKHFSLLEETLQSGLLCQCLGIKVREKFYLFALEPC